MISINKQVSSCSTSSTIQLRRNKIRAIRIVLVLALIIVLKPPYPKTEASAIQPVTRPAATVHTTEALPPVQPLAPQPVVVEQAVVTHPIGCENYRQLVSKYNWNVETFLRIAAAESGCNPYQVGDNYVINGLHAPSCGLFQVRTLQGRPSCEELKDPATNIAWAYRIYQGQGLSAWSVCSNGRAHCY